MRRSLVAAAAAAVMLAFPVPARASATDFHSVPLPFFWPKASLNAVSSDGAGGVWVGGVQGVYCVWFGDYCHPYLGNPVVRHWTGSGWREFPLNGWSGAGPIMEVASGPGETWVEGLQNASGRATEYLARFDGSAFQKVETPNDDFVAAISAGAGGVWAAANPRVAGQPQAAAFRRDAEGWTSVGLPDGMAAVNDVRARSATDVWAAGSGGAGSGEVPVLGHFDGTSWTSVPSPNLGRSARFLKVVPVGAEDVWAVTDGDLAHWDGSGWTVVPAPPDVLSGLQGLAVDASGTPWVSSAGVYRYAGGSWRTATLPDGVRVGDIAAVAGTSTIWGAGWSGSDAAVVSAP